MRKAVEELLLKLNEAGITTVLALFDLSQEELLERGIGEPELDELTDLLWLSYRRCKNRRTNKSNLRGRLHRIPEDFLNDWEGTL